MSVKVIVNGRSYTVSFDEFEKMLSRTVIGTCIEIVDFVGGAKYVC
jgi:hypothetical protein